MDIGVLTVVVVLLAAAATHAVVRAVRHRADAGGQMFRAWWAGVLAVMTMVALAVEVGHHQRTALATRAMSAVTDNPNARADCERFTQALLNLSQFDGYVYWDNPDVALYRRSICKDLAAYAGSSKRDPSLDQIAAVHLIAHETMHVNGLRNEAETECHAMQVSHLVAEALGATAAQARALQARYFAEIYPNIRSDYRSGDCREGGAYDIHPERAEFP